MVEVGVQLGGKEVGSCRFSGIPGFRHPLFVPFALFVPRGSPEAIGPAFPLESDGAMFSITLDRPLIRLIPKSFLKEGGASARWILPRSQSEAGQNGFSLDLPFPDQDLKGAFSVRGEQGKSLHLSGSLEALESKVRFDFHSRDLLKPGQGELCVDHRGGRLRLGLEGTSREDLDFSGVLSIFEMRDPAAILRWCRRVDNRGAGPAGWIDFFRVVVSWAGLAARASGSPDIAVAAGFAPRLLESAVLRTPTPLSEEISTVLVKMAQALFETKMHLQRAAPVPPPPPVEMEKDEAVYEMVKKPPAPPRRYFATRLEGGPETAEPAPRLLVGKEYRCVFGLRAEPDPTGGQAAEIPADALARMLARQPQVLVVGEGLEIRDGFKPLRVNPTDYTSGEEAAFFRASRPGPCLLRLLLMLDGNTIQALEFLFEAVLSLGVIPEGEPIITVCVFPGLEEQQRLRKQKLHISVGRNGETLLLNFIWGTKNTVILPLTTQNRTDLENKKKGFLDKFANSMGHKKSVSLTKKDCTEFLAELQALGEDIFRAFFVLPGGRDLADTGQEMRELLIETQPAAIQIDPGQEHLPWMFLSDGSGALGLRHEIEYIPSGRFGLSPLDLTQKPLNLVCGLASVFQSIQLEDGRNVLEVQREALARLPTDRFRVKLAEDERGWLEALSHPTDLIYAYCHGATGQGNPCLWMTQPALAIRGSDIDNKDSGIDWSRHPLVILAACTSGAVDPFRAVGLVNSFMTKGARGLLGLEGEVPSVFAALFMKEFFEEFFLKGGEQLGDVLFDLRQRFLRDRNNPWGILLQQFCRSEMTVSQT